MCCIFTCCGWMIDLIQRLWTFTMSCCISSAVCCALLTASVSGIALGYNYSLAEYIDLKETNVSVYLKRGIFDDEIGDDMTYRRSGHMPVAGHIGEHNLITGEPDEESASVRSGRRLDDSIYESDDRNKFEGSLMKLTARPPAPSSTTRFETTIDPDKILSKYSMGSLDQMKALKSLINMRKSEDPRFHRVKEEKQTTEQYIDDRYIPKIPVDPNKLSPGRKFMPLPPIPGMKSTQGNSARLAVPDELLNEQAKWRLPKLPPEAFTKDEFGNYDERPTYPMPVTPRAGPVRPTRRKATPRTRTTLTTVSTPIIGIQESIAKSIDEEMDAFKDKLLFDPNPSIKDDTFIKNMKGQRPDDDDYGDAVKGIPMRKKRDTIILDTFKNIDENKTSTLNDSSSDNVENIGMDNSLFKLQNSLSNDLQRDVNKEVLRTSDKLQGSTNPEDAISKGCTSNIILKLLKTI